MGIADNIRKLCRDVAIQTDDVLVAKLEEQNAFAAARTQKIRACLKDVEFIIDTRADKFTLEESEYAHLILKTCGENFRQALKQVMDAQAMYDAAIRQRQFNQMKTLAPEKSNSEIREKMDDMTADDDI